LDDVFVEPGSTDGMIVFDGNPPFNLELSIKDISASHTELASIQVYSHAWNLNLPSYTFKSIGPHLVTIESVVDSSNCAQAALDPLHSSIWVDVAENAAVIPFERREDYCVGEATQFQLEGIPPWSISLVSRPK
jgi:nucleoporin POM152